MKADEKGIIKMIKNKDLEIISLREVDNWFDLEKLIKERAKNQ